MCGVAGIYSAGAPPYSELYEALILLQHRGQDAAGMMTYDTATKSLHQEKGCGLVRDVFDRAVVREDGRKLPGHFGIGHVRYPTSGVGRMDEVQPFYVNSPCGIGLAHNGNLINAQALRDELTTKNKRHINTASDSEILLNILAHELALQSEDSDLQMDASKLFAAVERLYARCQGSYAVVAVVVGLGLLAFRDPLGIRPMVIGEREGDEGKEYMVASESVATDSLGFERMRDIAPGEAILITERGEMLSHRCSPERPPRSCAFEYVYLARPDSILDEVFVHKARMRMGDSLTQKVLREWGDDHGIDSIIPVPDTSRTAALEMALQLGAKYREGFIKNRYVGRTFIMPLQSERKQSVRRKLHPLDIEFQDKTVLIVDDSIVRGTTSQQIVQLARESGARKVYFASAAPPVRHPNIYGIDMPANDELVAHGRSEDEVRDFIGADRLIYQDLPDLTKAITVGNPRLSELECSVFDGNYAHELPRDYLDHLKEMRNDKARCVSN